MIELMLYVMIPAVSVLGLSSVVLQQHRKKLQLQKEDEYAKRINDIKAAYKATLELFSMQRIIRPVHVNSLYAIVNNYFVCQPVTEENMRQLDKLANRISITIAKEVNMTKSEEDTEWLKKKLLNFAILLPNPNRAKEFNKRFYQSRMSTLLRGLNTTKSSFIQRHGQAA